MSDLPPYVQIDKDVLDAFIAERNELFVKVNTPCPVCQGFNRYTTDMVCMMCGRDYLDDRPVPGLGWKRLMDAWREQAKTIEAERDEWKQRAEMTWRQRDRADRRAQRLEDENDILRENVDRMSMELHRLRKDEAR